MQANGLQEAFFEPLRRLREKFYVPEDRQICPKFFGLVVVSDTIAPPIPRFLLKVIKLAVFFYRFLVLGSRRLFNIILK
jgi:hypothetical protein